MNRGYCTNRDRYREALRIERETNREWNREGCKDRDREKG